VRCWPNETVRGGPVSKPAPHLNLGVLEMTYVAIKFADKIEELEFQLSWWEANYGNGVFKAPTREMNDAFIKAVDEQDNKR